MLIETDSCRYTNVRIYKCKLLTKYIIQTFLNDYHAKKSELKNTLSYFYLQIIYFQGNINLFDELLSEVWCFFLLVSYIFKSTGSLHAILKT